jgi:hypothetical protein
MLLPRLERIFEDQAFSLVLMALFRSRCRRALEGPDARGIFRRFVTMRELLRIAIAGVEPRIIAVFEQLDGYDGARLAFPDSHGVLRGEQLADAFWAGYFHNPGTGRDQNTAFGEMHTFPELRAGVV